MMMHRRLSRTLLATVLLAGIASLGAGPCRAQSGAPALEARVVPGETPTLQLVVPPLSPGDGAPRPRLIEIVLDTDSLADAVIREETDTLWQDIGRANGVLQNAGGDPPWFLMRSDAAEPGKTRLGIANFDLNGHEGQNALTRAGDQPLRVILPLRPGDRSLPLQVSVGTSLDALSPPVTVEARLEKPAEPDREARVRFDADMAPLTALALGTTVTLSWDIRPCVQATLSGPVDYREPVLTIAPEQGACTGSKKVLALGPATYQLTAETTGTPDSRLSVILTRTLFLDVRRLDQFANLSLSPPSVLPGGTVKARWYIRELPADDRREAVLAWTDLHGNRRLQRLRASASQTTAGEMSFVVPQAAGEADTTVRLHYGDETIERAFDIERWQAAGRSALATGELRGMAFAGGRLVLCSEKGLFFSAVGAGGGMGADGVGKVNEPFPDFVREPLRVGDRASSLHPVQESPCLAVHALDAERVAALVAIGETAPGRPAFAEMTIVSPDTQTATYPVTLADDPIDTAAPQRRDYQLALLRGRILVQVQIGPTDRSTDLNPRSSVKAFSISESDIATGKGGWRAEPLLATNELRPRYGWQMIDGFGADNETLFLLNEVSGTLARYEVTADSAALLAEARASGSPARLAAARAAVAVDYPVSARSVGREQVDALAQGPLVNVGGVLVSLGAGLAYNPQTNEWQPGSFGQSGGTGSVAAYRGDNEPRLWLMKANGERFSLPVESPRLFAADYFENRRVASLPYLERGARLTIKSRAALTWRTDRRTELQPKAQSLETGTCTVKGVTTSMPMVVSEYALAYPDRPFELIGVSDDGRTSVSKAHLGKGAWDVTISSDPCVTVRVEPAPVASR
ncbi:hypothetical protein [Ancylobacter sp.]|uniref:hypothetical protein n=1 Tax=Ancylobacter sp. TaxID=1872567 RepID=UPI003D0BD445